MKRRVVVTGVGCVTPLGTSVPALWGNLMEGKSGVGMTTLFDASNFPTKISAEVRDWSIASEGKIPPSGPPAVATPASPPAPPNRR